MIIRDARKSEFGIVCDLLVASFFNDPFIGFIYPDSKRRAFALPKFFEAYVELAWEGGGLIHLTEDNAGVMVTFAPDSPGNTELSPDREASFNARLQEISGCDTPSVMEGMRGLAAHHPKAPPHFYTFLVAVRPEHRGSRCFFALENHLAAIMDRADRPGYAELTSPRFRNLSYRLGWRPAGPPIRFEHCSDLFPVWRDPHTQVLSRQAQYEATIRYSAS